MAFNYYLTRWSDKLFDFISPVRQTIAFFIRWKRRNPPRILCLLLNFIFWWHFALAVRKLERRFKGNGKYAFSSYFDGYHFFNSGHIIRRIYSWMVWLSKIGCARCGSSCANFQCLDGYRNFIKTKI